MNRFIKLVAGVAAIIALSHSAPEGSANAADRQPNILLIIVDDMGYDDLSINGNTCSRTPNLERFAESSVWFSNFMVNSVCAPTRGSLLTGLDYHRAGMGPD